MTARWAIIATTVPGSDDGGREWRRAVTSWLAVLALGAAAVVASPAAARAQGGSPTRGGEPPVSVEWVRACFDPSTGDIYLIGIGGLPPRCRSTSHREILWQVRFPAGAVGSRSGEERSGSDTAARRGSAGTAGRESGGDRAGGGSALGGRGASGAGDDRVVQVEATISVPPCEGAIGVCNPPARQSRHTGRVSCPAGRVAVDGGVREAGRVEVEWRGQDRQRPQDWLVRVYNTRDVSVSLTIYARCALADAGSGTSGGGTGERGASPGTPFRTDRTVQVPACAGSTSGVCRERRAEALQERVACPARHLAREGGASEAGGTTDVRVEASVRDANDQAAWVVRASNAAAGARSLQLWAVCVPPAPQR